jgi:excisionase family DNA binding protein
MEILTRQELSTIFKLNLRTLDYLVSTHQIPYSRIGRRMVRFDRERIEAWFKQREGLSYKRGQKRND